MEFCGIHPRRISLEVLKVWIHKMSLKNKLTGGRLNKKDGLTRYGDSHVKDKTS